MTGKKKVERAGVIPYYIDDDQQIQMLFMQPSDPHYGGDKFQIAKGKVDPEDDSDRDAAFREAGEELGLFSGNVIHEKKIGQFLGRTHIYVCRINDPDMFGDPNFETEQTKWMTPEQFDNEGRELHQPVIKAAVRYIKKKEDLD